VQGFVACLYLVVQRRLALFPLPLADQLYFDFIGALNFERAYGTKQGKDNDFSEHFTAKKPKQQQ
jgi:hypothetical protein